MTRMSPRGNTRAPSSEAALPYIDARELAMLLVVLSPPTLPYSSARTTNASRWHVPATTIRRMHQLPATRMHENGVPVQQVAQLPMSAF